MKILVKFYQAVTNTQVISNLQERMMGWSQETKSIIFKEYDGTTSGATMVIPSMIGDGMNTVVSAVGFSQYQLIRLDTTGKFTSAISLPNGTKNATHFVFNVSGTNVFVAKNGSWWCPGLSAGDVYLSNTSANTITNNVSNQKIGTYDGSRLHLGLEGGDKLTSTGIVSGTYGSSTMIPTFTVGVDGRLTLAGQTPITVSGASGGTVTSIGINSTTLSVGQSPIITSGDINVNLPSVITSGTYVKLVVDTYGRVVSGGPLTSADIPLLPYLTTLPTASTSTSGVLTSADWNTFNNKQNSITSATNLIINTLSGTHIGNTSGLATSSIYASIIPNTTVASGSYGSSTQIPVISIGQDGRITSATNITLSAGTVTSIGVSSSNLTITNTPITSSGIVGVSLTSIVTSGVATKVSYDSFGRIISSAALTSADIPVLPYISTLPTASSSTSGILTSSDWNTFNNKQSVITSASNLIVNTLSGTHIGNTSGLATSSIYASIIPNTTVVSGNYGTSTQIPVISIGQDGRITSATTITLSGGGGGTVTSVGVSSSNIIVSNSPITTNGVISISLSSVGTPGTYTKTTIDSFGRVTSGGALTSADIPALPYVSTIPVTTWTSISAIPTASTSTSGVLISSDWNTFINKQNAITSATNLIVNSISGTHIGNTSGLATSSIYASIIPNTSVTSGSYGSSTLIPIITIGQDGRITSASTISLSGVGGGSVTSVGVSSSNLSITNTPITTNGVISVTLPSIVTSGTSTKVVYDSFGRITSGGILTSADIPALPYVSTIPVTTWTSISAIPTASTSTSGVLTSADWNTFNNKQSTINSSSNLIANSLSATNLSATNIYDTNFVGGFALVSNANKSLVESIVTTFELNTLSAVTSDVQAQINSKQNTITSSSNIIVNTLSGTHIGNTSGLATSSIYASIIPNTTITSGSYGSSTQIPTFTVGADGRLTLAGQTAISVSGAGGGTVVSVATSSTTLTIAGSPIIVSGVLNINLTSGISTPGTYIKQIVDTYGRVVSGGPLTSADIPALPYISSLPTASTSTSGVLTSADWNTFNNKQNSITSATNLIINSLSGTHIGNTSGLATSSIYASIIPNTTVTSGSYGSSTQIPIITIGQDGRITSATTITLSGGGSVTSVGVSSSNLIVTNSPITSSGIIGVGLTTITTSGTSTKIVYDSFGRVTSGGFLTSADIPALPYVSTIPVTTWTSISAIPTASTNTSGVLTSSDWNTFNNKQNIITSSSNLIVNSISGTHIGNTSGLATSSIYASIIPNTSVTSGSYGSSTQIPVFNIGQDGRITSASVVTLSAGTVSSVGVSSSTLSISNSPIISSGTIVANLTSGIATPGTYTKTTIDTFGRVTSGGILTSADIPALPYVSTIPVTTWTSISSIPTASSITSGVLTSDDWNTFNNKQSAITSASNLIFNTLSGTFIGNISGTSTNAKSLLSPRNISLVGSISSTPILFDGTSDIAINTSINNTGVVSGVYGSSTQIPQFVIGIDGRILSASSLTISGGGGSGSLSGSAGGDLSGTYPNPIVTHVTTFSKTLTYTSGVLTSISEPLGTKTFLYTSGVMTGISGTGIYQSKSLVYTSGVLTNINIV